MYVLLILLSLSVAAVSAAQSPQPCSSKDMKNYTINSTSSLVDLAANTLRCAVIKVTADDITLTQLITFKDLFNVSMIGQSQLTEISCSNNSGFKFVDSELVFISNIQFSGCSLIDTVPHSNHSNSHADQAALYVYNSSNITIADCHFINNPATGLMLHEVTGSNHILSCNFSLNKPKLEHEELNVTCGGLIIYRDKRTERASYVVDSCIFADNKNTLEYLGGGMSVLLSANGSNSSISINNSIFMDNVGYVGGGLFLVRNKPLYGVVDIYNTTFLSNVAIHEGGGLETVNMDVGTFCLHLYNCVFDSNFAAFGGGISGYVPPFGEGRVNITAHSTNWTRNGASTSGFAVALYEDASFDQVRNIQLTLEDCSVFNNSLANFNSSKNAVGAIYVYGSEITFRGSNEVRNNYGSALYMRENGRAVFDRNDTTFSHNKATRGGAVTLQSSSTLHFATSEVTVYFVFNSATEKGGAIYAELEEDDLCLFDSNFPTRPADSVVWFIENYANNFNERQSIYISGNDPRQCINTTDNSTYLRTEFFKYENESNSSVLFDADTVQLQHNNSIQVMLGENFYLDPVILDRFEHETTTSAHVSLTYEGINDDISKTHKLNFSYVGPNFLGLDNYTKNNELNIKGVEVHNSSNVYLQIFFEKKIAGYRDGFLNVTIELTPCRLGFVYNQNESMCKCFMSDDHGQMFCPNSSLACVRSGYWFGRSTNGHFSFICDNLLCNYTNQKCPTDVCPNAPDYCIVNNTDDLCYNGRGGILCSRCQENYAFTFTGYKCVPDNTCKAQNSALVILGVFLYWILLICLVFIILRLNFSFGTGFASGIIYYFSVVFVLTDTVLSDNSLSIILNMSVAVTQLCARLFGQIPVCFFKQWDYNLHHQMFHFVSPLFVVATILAIICFFRYCKCPKRLSLAENSPNHAICLLILTSYTSMTYTCFEILRPISINGHWFVYMDPEIPYFHPRLHLPYALFAIFVELFVSLPICFLLLFAPCLSRLSRVNLVKLRLKPIVDEYQACYKENHRWYAGFYFLARQLMYLANCMSVQLIPQSNSLFHLICVVILLVQTLVQPYKKQFWYLNVVDTLLLTDLLLLSVLPINTSLNTITTSVPSYINIIQVVTPYVLILLPSLYIFGIIFLLLVRYIRRIIFKSCCAKKPLQDDAAPLIRETHTRNEVHFEDSEDDRGKLERATFSDSFFKDHGEREPLLRDTNPPAYSTAGGTQRRGPEQKQEAQRGFTTTSLRMSGSHMESFPPEAGKALTN